MAKSFILHSFFSSVEAGEVGYSPSTGAQIIGNDSRRHALIPIFSP
jgi:hypothetical protein